MMKEYSIMLKYPNLSPENLVIDIKRWLESGGSPHVTKPDTGSSLLHDAAAYQDVAAIEYLYALGCDVNLRDAIGDTPLHVAVLFEVDTSIQTGEALDFKVTKRLIELGADTTIQNILGDTVADWIDTQGDEIRARYEEILSQTD
jgi:hypothetical protein